MLLLRVLMVLLRGVLGVAVLGCVAASCFFAFEFGATRSPEWLVSWGFALTAVFLDLLKAGLPLLAAESDDRARKVGCWVAFSVFTCMSLWCAYGMTATQLAERLSNKIVAQSDLDEKSETLKRLRAERDAMGTFARTTAEMVKAQQDTVDALSAQIESEKARGGCKKICSDREADERTARAVLLKLQTDKATTDAAADLDRQIAAAELALAGVNKKEAVKQADPQTENMAKVLNISVDTVALISHAVLAVSIEFGSGLGFWLVFGHGVGIRRRPEAAASASTPAAHETDDDARLRFFQECIASATGKRVSATGVHGAYIVWCAAQGRMPMSSQAFGKDGPWPKEKIGGNVYYLNCEIRDRTRPSLQVVPMRTRHLGVLQPAS